MPDGPEITRLFYEPNGEPTRVPLVLAPAQVTRSRLSERHDEDAGLTAGGAPEFVIQNRHLSDLPSYTNEYVR